ncbi:FAD-dependent monooxygenase [Allokutzneria sp. A3M-2-11 16]|uniref:FAD-dependent oxidoreductase n=1 Tax=Allokutzneria sp. A3M-2-11 16 TaxID=2962043 RepID=UPI0020B7EBAF|nr:FAD-dependent monooxygenase [Allokutzneria sp. A3M-2-11 16]MCP3805522.1 FAD-dependent monooxygenase [Allokutzneria sp. A3M-2-11 16]
MSTDFDVVVCGAGAGGLAAAAALGSLGARILLLDKQPTRPSIAKGELLQPGALATLRKWGAEQALIEHGAPALDSLSIRAPSGEALLRLDYSTLPDDGGRLLSADYHVILAAIEASLPGSVTLRRGSRVEELLRDKDGRVAGVRAEGTEIRAALVVAADGIGSSLRSAAGIAGKRGDYPHRLLTLDIADTRSDELSAFVTARGLRLVYPLPGGRTRLYVQVEPDELRGVNKDALREWTGRMLDEVPALEWLREGVLASLGHRQLLPVPRFLADRLSAPGLALVGESAHAVHPMAAQGMNTAIGDAVTLAAGLDGFGAADVDRALARYDTERMPEVKHISTVSHNAARMITDLSPFGRLLGRTLMRNTARNPRLLAATSRNMAGVGVRPLRLIDRFYQLGVLRDRNAHLVSR